jgi:REP element-mobilizing transposase RayT
MRELEVYKHKRKSFIEIGSIFFWTATIKDWSHLLKEVRFKNIVLDSMSYLSEKKLVDIFAFVIMPNHIHLIWRTNKLNGKETVQGSFLKYTAHEFRKILLKEGKLSNYEVNAINKKHEFWQRDSLAIHLYSKEVAFQKLEYIHNNPCTEKWNLAMEPQDYYYSSDRFYTQGCNEFKFLRDLRDEF